MSVFPPIPLAEWADTKETLHRFLQVVGKLRLANAPRRNHWWHVPFHLTGRGLTTRPMGFDPVFAVDLDLVDHRLEVAVADGRLASFPLPGLSVAAFYRQLLDTTDPRDAVHLDDAEVAAAALAAAHDGDDGLRERAS